MNGAKTDERNYYAESYIALIEAIIKETASIIKDIKKAIEFLNTGETEVESNDGDSNTA